MGSSSASTSSSTTPGQPIQAPRRRRSSGSKRGDQTARAALPGRACRRAAAPGRPAAGWRPPRSRNPRSAELAVFGVRAPPGSHLCLVFRRPNTEHRQEDAALVGVVRVGGYDAPGLAGGVSASGSTSPISCMVRFRRHYITVCEVGIRDTRRATLHTRRARNALAVMCNRLTEERMRWPMAVPNEVGTGGGDDGVRPAGAVRPKSLVAYETLDEGRIARIWLNRPEAHNAQSRGLLVNSTKHSCAPRPTTPFGW